MLNKEQLFAIFEDVEVEVLIEKLKTCLKRKATNMTKTLDEWAALDNIRIIDPDGFDRSDPDLMTKQFTKEEYKKGIFKCTLMCIPPKYEFDGSSIH
jgi:hypothetical protein